MITKTKETANADSKNIGISKQKSTATTSQTKQTKKPTPTQTAKPLTTKSSVKSAVKTKTSSLITVQPKTSRLTTRPAVQPTVSRFSNAINGSTANHLTPTTVIPITSMTRKTTQLYTEDTTPYVPGQLYILFSYTFYSDF